jgi:hypothetical protein
MRGPLGVVVNEQVRQPVTVVAGYAEPQTVELRVGERDFADRVKTAAEPVRRDPTRDRHPPR